MFPAATQCTKRGREELRGQGQWPRVPGCDSTGTAERSYPASEVRGRSQECQAATVQEWPRGATPHPRPEAVPERSHPTSEVRGGGERSHLAPKARGSGQEEQPHVQGAVAAWMQEGLEEPSHIEGQEGRW